jgi:hypothetical protein
MRHTIHIFLKDARRSWPYTAVVFAITAILAVLTPKWAPAYNPATSTRNNTVDFLQLLLPVAWWFTIAHVVHGEELVGDRQFWVTRPYSWKSLCAAKVLFCVAFLAAPFLICDCIILSADGFSPAAMIPGLLWRQYYLAAMLLLPPFVLAALTRTMRHFALTCLAILIAFLVLTDLLPIFFWTGLTPFQHFNALAATLNRAHPGARSWFEAWGAGVLFGAGGLSLLLWQYALRRTAAVRIVVMALLAWGLISSAWPPRAVARATAAQPPVPTAEYPEIAVVFAPEHGRPNRPGISSGIDVFVPIELTGRNRELLDDRLVAVIVTPEGGEAWIPAGWGYSHPPGGGDWITLSLDRRDFERLNRAPVKLQALFGVIVYEKQSVVKLRPGGEWAKIPGFGAVAIPQSSSFPLVCWRAPLQLPSVKIAYTIRGPDSAVLCQGEWSGTYPPASGDTLHISPVVYSATPVNTPGLNRSSQLRLTSADEAEFTVERPLALVRRDLLIPAVRLGDYVVTSP